MKTAQKKLPVNERCLSAQEIAKVQAIISGVREDGFSQWRALADLADQMLITQATLKSLLAGGRGTRATLAVVRAKIANG